MFGTSLAFLALVSALTLAGSAQASDQCREFFEKIGKPKPASFWDAPPASVQSGMPLTSGGDLTGCFPEFATEFKFDQSLVEAAKPVESMDQLIGTWVSDDIFVNYAAESMKNWQVFDIEPGSGSQQISITHKVLRVTDPAKPGFRGPVQEAANPGAPSGRVAVYGQYSADFSLETGLTASSSKTFDIVLDFNQQLDEARKAIFPNFSPGAQFDLAAQDGRLVLFQPNHSVFSVGGQDMPAGRYFTFRRSSQQAPEQALMSQMAVFGSDFLCILNRINTDDGAFDALFTDWTRSEFFVQLNEYFALMDRSEQLRSSLRDPALSDEEFDALLAKSSDLNKLIRPLQAALTPTLDKIDAWVSQAGC